MKYRVKTSICISTGLTPTAAFHKPESKPNQSVLSQLESTEWAIIRNRLTEMHSKQTRTPQNEKLCAV